MANETSIKRQMEQVLSDDAINVAKAARARLIAAAPEQHDALKRAQVALADIQKRWTDIPAYASTDITAALNVINTAIAKAEGR